MTFVAHTNALWTLAHARAEIGGFTDTTHDAIVQAAVNGVSQAFEEATARKLAFRDFRTFGEYYDGTGRADLWLRAGPIIELWSVAVENGATIDTANWDAQGDDLRTNDDKTALFRGWRWGVWPKARRNVLINYAGGYRQVPDTGTSNQAQWLPWDLHKAGLREISRAYYDQDRVKGGIKSRSFEGEAVTYFAPGDLLPATRQILYHYALDMVEVDG